MPETARHNIIPRPKAMDKLTDDSEAVARLNAALEMADRYEIGGALFGDARLDFDDVRAALRIASRVLDEGAEERLARVIAAGLGDELDHAFVNKGEWNRRSGEKGGRYRDINEPMLDDYLEAARAVLAHIRGAG